VPDWHQFRVGQPSTKPGWVEPDCQPLTQISHVAHIDVASDILRDGKIKSGLVYDKSKLNKQRILVSWLSPNNWVWGSRYGNVEFVFDWRRIIEGMNYFWVESVAYHPPACRILVTKHNYSNELSEYDPTLGDGPWWYDEAENQHYWNGDICLEIMVEQDIPVKRSLELKFVDHHRRFCSIDPGVCTDLGLSSDLAGARFMAGAISRRLDTTGIKLTDVYDGTVVPSMQLDFAWRRLCRELQREEAEYLGKVAFGDEAAQPIARAILSAFSSSDHAEHQRLASLFTTKGDMLRSCVALVNNAFAIPEPEALDSHYC